jgi:sarcosine oxidase gamma subunit
VNDAAALLSVDFADHSARPRFGCKGPGAGSWLAAQGRRLPLAPNSATLDADGVLVAKLGSSEYLIEAVAGGGEPVAAMRAGCADRARPRDVYPVAREDRVLTISGSGLQVLLRQTCSVDFAPLLEAAGAANGPLVLTSMVGVGVVAWPRRLAGSPAVTLWCEPSYAHYFWETLLDIGEGQGTITRGGDTGGTDR